MEPTAVLACEGFFGEISSRGCYSEKTTTPEVPTCVAKFLGRVVWCGVLRVMCGECCVRVVRGRCMFCVMWVVRRCCGTQDQFGARDFHFLTLTFPPNFMHDLVKTQTSEKYQLSVEQKLRGCGEHGNGGTTSNRLARYL